MPRMDSEAAEGEQMTDPITVPKAAEIIGVSRAMVNRWCNQGRLEYRWNRTGPHAYRELSRAYVRRWAKKPRPPGRPRTKGKNDAT